MNHYSYLPSCERCDNSEVDPCLAANIRLRRPYCFGLSRLKFYFCLLVSFFFILLLSVALLAFFYRDYIPLFANATSRALPSSPPVLIEATAPPAATTVQTEVTSRLFFETLSPTQTKVASAPLTEVTSAPLTEVTSAPLTEVTSAALTEVMFTPLPEVTSAPLTEVTSPSQIEVVSSTFIPDRSTPNLIVTEIPTVVNMSIPSNFTIKVRERQKLMTGTESAVPSTVQSWASSYSIRLKPKQKALLPVVRQENASTVNFFLDAQQKYDYISTPTAKENCDDHYKAGYKQSGVYKLHLPTTSEEFYALCLMDDSSGWTVLQRRTGHALPFWNNSFVEYAAGFGDAASDHWLGLERVHSAAEKGLLRLRILLYGDFCMVDLKDPKRERKVCSGLADTGFWWADWQFSIADKANKYRLENVQYLRGNLSSADKDYFTDESKNMRFTTCDVDSDESNKNCARWMDKGAWWHKSCTHTSLNGKYGEGSSRSKGQAWHYADPRNSSFYNIKPKNSLMLYQYL